ncbi:boLa class II histocompatibility antigen, DQB*0101 beta chain [Puntigrus tetrazona]|uniref:boLa class II histocompatibility antigen, DQB*0101 beta chain n=1 Tax=Puntigrus tetrazona TaxID=1606681 RepID=UPI001C8917C9|nr:boLa class II histocompatibility antigen, DQB*0101 beta chain [Puntigrus tetrazona]
MDNMGIIQTFISILLLSPQITMWTDYQTVNVLAYTRMTENGSVDQAVVVLVNDAPFAYFDQANKTFILRPSASAGFSVLESSDQSFCMYEVLAGFNRQTDYLEKFKQQTNSSKALLVPPSVNVYTEFPQQQGKVNVLYCLATGFYPADIEINFYLNGQRSTAKAETSDLMYGEDWSFRVYKYMNITPQRGDKYACEVRHSSMAEPKMAEWRPEFSASTSHLYWICALLLGMLLGITVSVLIVRRKQV